MQHCLTRRREGPVGLIFAHTREHQLRLQPEQVSLGLARELAVGDGWRDGRDNDRRIRLSGRRRDVRHGRRVGGRLGLSYAQQPRGDHRDLVARERRVALERVVRIAVHDARAGDCGDGVICPVLGRDVGPVGIAGNGRRDGNAIGRGVIEDLEGFGDLASVRARGGEVVLEGLDEVAGCGRFARAADTKLGRRLPQPGQQALSDDGHLVASDLSITAEAAVWVALHDALSLGDIDRVSAPGWGCPLGYRGGRCGRRLRRHVGHAATRQLADGRVDEVGERFRRRPGLRVLLVLLRVAEELVAAVVDIVAGATGRIRRADNDHGIFGADRPAALGPSNRDSLAGARVDQRRARP